MMVMIMIPVKWFPDFDFVEEALAMVIDIYDDYETHRSIMHTHPRGTNSSISVVPHKTMKYMKCKLFTDYDFGEEATLITNV